MWKVPIFMDWCSKKTNNQSWKNTEEKLRPVLYNAIISAGLLGVS